MIGSLNTGRRILADQVRRPKLWRNEVQVSVGATDTKILGPNPRRWAVIFGTPAGGASGGGQQFASKTQSAHNASAAAAGIVLTYTVPAGLNSMVTAVQVFDTVGAPTLVVFYTPNGGAKLQASGALGNGTIQPIGIPLAAGDNFTLEVKTPVAGSTVDCWLGIQEYSAGGGGSADNTVFISLDGAASVNGGMPLHPGTDPLRLLYDHVGQAMREEIRGIAASTPVTLTVWDIFEVDCPCLDM